MGYRYCDHCNKWLETAEYTVDSSGETVCPKDDHDATHGFILEAPVDEDEYRARLPNYYNDVDRMVQAGKDQELIE
jgi:hypothetical protein